MTNEEINIAIAEACGWERGNSSLQQEWLRPSRKEHRTFVSSWVTVEGLPDYCNDLNAMHEAEKMLSADQTFLYREEIYTLIGDPDVDMYGWYSTHATARQRAEAFLRTIGKWEEVK